MERVRRAAVHLKKNYGCKVILFGSLLREDRFMEHSDIDIALSGLSDKVNFWKLYSEVMDILAPFDFDLVELEKIEPEIRGTTSSKEGWNCDPELEGQYGKIPENDGSNCGIGIYIRKAQFHL